MRSDTVNQDDLTILKGIGPARQQWLRDSFAVQTFADLAALMPDDVEQRLKVDGQIARREAIEEWLAQAQALATGVSARETDETAEPNPEWRPFASFVVEIQAWEADAQESVLRTAVQHIETDNNAAWHGIEREKLCEWIISQVDREVERFTKQQTAVSAPKAPLMIEQVEIWQPPAPQKTIEAQRPLPIILQSQQPFTLTTNIIPTQQETAVEIGHFVVQFDARNLLSGKQWSLGETVEITASDLPTIAQLPSISLPSGQYRLMTRISLSNPEMADGYFELPFVQVI